jgi:hypothetical protein
MLCSNIIHVLVGHIWIVLKGHSLLGLGLEHVSVRTNVCTHSHANHTLELEQRFSKSLDSASFRYADSTV